jgi:hypothetical protein
VHRAVPAFHGDPQFGVGLVLAGIGNIALMRYGVPKKITPAARRLRGLPMRR